MTETTEKALPVLRAVESVDDLFEAARLQGRTPRPFEMSEPAEANAVRGLNAARIFVRYRSLVGDAGEDLAISMADLFSDLHHLTTALGVDWDEVVDQASDYYHAEVAGEL